MTGGPVSGDGTIVSDGVGGAIVPWRRTSSAGSDIYATHLYPDGRTPTLASLVSADADARRVFLRWFAPNAAGTIANLYRRSDETGWMILGTVQVDGTEQITYEDRAVEPGGRYGYRIGMQDAGKEYFVGETWIVVPRVPQLSLEGAQPNPVRRDLVVSFSLRSAEPANMEVFDVSSRRILSDALGSLGPGSHLVHLEGGNTLPNGEYILRLTQGPQSMVARAVVLR